MTRSRTARIQRLLRAQTEIAAQAKRSHHEAREICAQRAADAGEIVNALNGQSPLHGLLVGTMASALSSNAHALRRAQADADDAAALSRYESLKCDLVATRAADTARALCQASHDRALRELVNLLSARPQNRSGR